MTATWLCPACHCHVPDNSVSLEQLAAAVAHHQTTHERRRP